jgi:pimeloyl-ACP methyl ester carboxylesterase
MKTIYLLLILIPLFSLSQVKSKNSPKDFGFTSFKIKGRLDTINFIVGDTSFNKKKPIFLFSQGSLPYAIFFKDSIKVYEQAIPFDYKKHMGEYTFVIISKPDIPIFSTTQDSTNYYYVDPITKETPRGYYIKNYLDWYVTAADDVIKFLVKQKWVDKSKIVIAGHSQGSKIVSKLGAINKYVTHVIYLSGNPLGRFDQYIRDERRDVIYGKTSSKIAQENINNLYAQYKNIVNNKNDNKNGGGDSFMATASFSEPLLPYILSTKIPFYCAYGTDDITSSYCDILPLDFIRKNKNNLILKPYLDCDHNFMKHIKDENGKDIISEELWETVADEFFDFLKQSH